jgi:hypothetical protein
MVGEVCGGAVYVSAAYEPNGQLGEYKKKWEVVLVIKFNNLFASSTNYPNSNYL